MKSKNKGIKTTLNGRQYRSRLEAKWAAFFKLLGWKFEYEPIDLKGWIPDFMLFGHKPILVEVKPIYHFGDDFELAHELRGQNTTGYEILICGVSITENDDGAQLGWLLGEDGFDLANFGEFNHTDRYQQYGFKAYWGSWQDRISGLYAGDGHIIKLYSYQEILPLWNEASNQAQWQSQ